MSADAALLALGSRWETIVAEWNSAIANTDVENEALGARERALFAEIMALSARGPAGLAVKARVMARAMDCHDYSLAGVTAASAERKYNNERSALNLAADVLRIEREVAGRDSVLAALAAAEKAENGSDAALLALRRPRSLFEEELAAALCDLEARGGIRDADPRCDAAFAGKNAIDACIFAVPARTLEGILFKREVLEEWVGCDEEASFRAFIEADLLAMIEKRKAATATSHAKAA